MLFSVVSFYERFWYSNRPAYLLTGPCRNGGRRLLSPAGCAGIPRAANKSAPRRPPLRSGSKPSAASIAPGLSIAIEAAMVAGSKQ
jgi:hypothetical protein